MDWGFHLSGIDEDPLSAFLNTQDQEDKQDTAGDGEERKNKRLARNRESARNSRRRKKQYIQYLESRIAQLTQEVTALRSGLAHTAVPPDQTFMTERKELYCRLNQAVHRQETSEAEVAEMLDELSMKLGVDAMGRQEVVGRMFQQTLEVMIPQHVKYFLWATDQDVDFFQPAPSCVNQAAWKELILDGGFTEEQCASIREYKGILVQEKDKMSDSLKLLKKTREALAKHSLAFQRYVEDVRSFLGPKQCAAFLLWLERHSPMPATDQVLSSDETVAALIAE